MDDQGNSGSKDSPNQPSSEPVKEESLLDRIFPKFNLPFSALYENTTVFISLSVISVLLAAGGTYIVAQNIFKPEVAPATISSFNEDDLPTFEDDESVAPVVSQNPSVTSLPSSASPAPTSVSATITQVPRSTATVNWVNYSFSQVFLSFSYPPGWFINLSSTSGAPYLYVQSYPTTTVPTNPSGYYSIYIGRLEQIGITTISQLETQLALNAANNTYFGSTNMGSTTVVSSTPGTINGYQSLVRVVTYSASPTVSYYEIYVLDGISNVIKFAPLMDVSGTISYLNMLLTTIQFSN